MSTPPNIPSNAELLRQCLEGTLEPEWQAEAQKSTPLAERIRATLAFAELLAETPLEAPPKNVHRAALAAGKGDSPLKRAQVWIASLFTPTADLQPAFRGSAAAPQLFHAGPFEVDVLRTATGAVVGELAPSEPDDETPATGLCCLFGEECTRTASLDEGEFRFEDVEPGSYRLVIELNPGEASAASIVVPELEL
jgi:hypothetical protein